MAAHHDEVRCAMIATFELTDAIAPGNCACDAQRNHHGLGSGIIEYDLFDAANPCAQMLGQCEFLRAWRRVSGAARQLTFDRRDDVRMPVAVDECGVVIVEIDARVAVEVGAAHSASVVDIERKGRMSQQ